MQSPVLAFTQGDPAGIGPEILLKLVAQDGALDQGWQPLLIAERAALAPLLASFPAGFPARLRYFDSAPDRQTLAAMANQIPVLDPVDHPRTVNPGQPSKDDAKGAIAALDAGIRLAQEGDADALVTAPVNKATIAQDLLPDFRGHTDYLAQAAGLNQYGHDYLMAFLAPDLRVALLSTHIPLTQALAEVDRESICAALRCLHRYAPAGRRRIAVAGLNPHAGEGGLLGVEDDAIVRPAVEAAQREGIDAHGPESADSLFMRARQGEFDWVLALYHDQGLIAVKTVSFGSATNWTLGLPFIRTSVDHGTAYGIAGQNVADVEPMRAVVTSTLELLTSNPSNPPS